MFTRRIILTGLLACSLPLTTAAQDIDTAPDVRADGWAITTTIAVPWTHGSWG